MSGMDSPKRIKVIACKVMLRQLYALAAESRNTIDIRWMRQALHSDPPEMRQWLGVAIREIDREEEAYDAICLAYGLCSNGIVGLCSEKSPLVVPRAHDCISLLLGSAQRYAHLFHQGNGGIYWFSQGWIEQSDMPSEARYQRAYQRYAQQYGEDNAQYLLDMEQGWMREYKKAIYIRWPNEDDEGERFTQASAAFHHWDYETVEGRPSLLKDLLDGPWDEDRFLVTPPGQSIQPAFDGRIVQAGSTGG